MFLRKLLLFSFTSLVILTGQAPPGVNAALRVSIQRSVPRVSVQAERYTLTNLYLPIVRRNACGKITTDTTWTVYHSPIQVACDVTVSSGVTLIIEAGVRVQFERLDADLIISGTLQVAGDEVAPVHFAPVGSSSPGSWGMVAFMTGSSGRLDHAILEYGGSSGGMVSISGDAVEVVDSVVQYSGGIGISIGDTSPLISGTQILSNTRTGISNFSGNPIIQNNTISNNHAYEWCCSDFPDGGGGLYNHHGSPTIQNNIISNNIVDDYGGYEGESLGGGFFSLTGSPIIMNNIFAGNSASGDSAAGGGIYSWWGDPIIQNNLFINNSVSGNYGSGGGVDIWLGSPIIENNIFTSNSASTGGGAFISGNSIIQNNTFVNNSASAGGGLYINGNQVIRNNIVANNAGSGIAISSFDNPEINLDYNDVWNNSGGNYAYVTPGTHDISADPLLVDPINSNYHLALNSPCIDIGDPDQHSVDDIEADPRPMGLAPDIGADEYRSLSVAKIGNTDETSPASSISYELTIANLVTATLSDVHLTDDLPAVTSFTGYQSEDLTCSHDGSPWGGRIDCTLINPFLPTGESRTLVVTVLITETFLHPQYVTNPVTVTAHNEGAPYIAHDQARTWVNWCTVQLNDTPMGSDLQAAIDASAKQTDVVKASGYCPVKNLFLNKTLILQGGWSYNFNTRNPAIHTPLDGQGFGPVIEVAGEFNPTIEGFTITGGGGARYGGGIYIPSGNPTVQNNTITRNSATFGGGVYNDSGNPTLQYNTFTHNSAGSGGGLYNHSGNPSVQNNHFTDNAVNYGLGGGLANLSGSPLIQNNTFSGNSTLHYGGGLYNGSGSPVIQNNTFSGNSATYVNNSECGGGIYNDTGGPFIQNNVFSGNLANQSGGGLYNASGNPVLLNNTFSGNSADYGGALYIYNASSGSLIINNILVNNTADTGGGIYHNSGAFMLDYNDVWNNTGGDYANLSPGTHDISADPLLVDPADNNFHLSPGSPCIDAGDPVNYPATDFEGDARPQGPTPDIGADEYKGGRRDIVSVILRGRVSFSYFMP